MQEQQDTFPLQKVLKVAGMEREFGNYLFRKQYFEGAKDRYKRVWHQKKIVFSPMGCESGDLVLAHCNKYTAEIIQLHHIFRYSSLFKNWSETLLYEQQ